MGKTRSYILTMLSGLCLFFIVGSTACTKEDETLYTEVDNTISIADGIVIDNGVKVKRPIFNFVYYDDFLKYIANSDHFLIVPLEDFKKTSSTDKVIISLRFDVDEDINAAVKLAYRNHKYGIKGTFFVLHSANYYGQMVETHFQRTSGKMIGPYFRRSDNVIFYLKKIQNAFGQEIGFHNDLITLQLLYGISSRQYLKDELAYLRGNNINILGTTYHGSQYCYIYKYFNGYFWYEYPDNGWNYEYITKGVKTIKIEKDYLENYGLYEGGRLGHDYYFSDSNFKNGKRWNMSMVNLDTVKPGKKVILLFHPANWD